MVNKTKLPIRTLFFFLITAVPGVMHGTAETIPGRWELVASLEAGTEITVKSFANEPVQGAFLKLDPEYLILSDPLNPEIRVLRNQVIEVIRVQTKKFWTATKIGALSGFAAGLVVGLAAGDDGVFDDMSAGSNGLILGGIGAGAGALVGKAVETTRRQEVVIYRSARMIE